MNRLGLIVVILFMCTICTCTVKLNVWFIMDIPYSRSTPFGVLEFTPETIWSNLKRSELLRRHLGGYTVAGIAATDRCNLNALKKMMGKFTPQYVNDVHAFIGPTCSYMCDVTGMISSSYSIPQVCLYCFYSWADFFGFLPRRVDTLHPVLDLSGG